MSAKTKNTCLTKKDNSWFNLGDVSPSERLKTFICRRCRRRRHRRHRHHRRRCNHLWKEKVLFLASKEKKSRLLRKKFRRIVQRKKPFLVRSDSFQFCLFYFLCKDFSRSILAGLMILIMNQEVIFPLSFYECADPENCQEWQILPKKMEVEGIKPGSCDSADHWTNTKAKALVKQ